MKPDTEPEGPSATFQEPSQKPVIRKIHMSHLSIEVGHFYMSDMEKSGDLIREQFKRIAPWIKAAEATVASGKNPARISTCFLIDDYFHGDSKPAAILEKLLAAADEAKLRIDYIAREAGCARSGDLELADLVAEKLQAEPVPGTNGSRPTTEKSGWLCNGERSPAASSPEAMDKLAWKKPQEFGFLNHSIFADVELWKDNEDLVNGQPVTQRTWSCPFLASVWQLLRLGLIRRFGEPVATPVPWWDKPWPEHWSELPTVIQINEHAKPFSAYRAVSVMPHTYLPIENAVRMIIDHLAIDAAVLEVVDTFAEAEVISVPRKVSERVTHVFVEGR
jgi:hypothetical protein